MDLESIMLILVGSVWLLILLLFIICACILAKKSDEDK